MRQLVWLDLCCGLKGASQPAIDRGWKVITVDIDPRFKPDIVADVRHLPLKPFHIDVLWASPPCQEFSKLGMPCFWPNQPDPDLSIVQSVYRAATDLNPRWWIIENVRSSRKWISPLLGPVRMCDASHALWGRLPGLLPNSHAKGARRTTGTGPYHRAPHIRAKIPYEIGLSICRAVENLQ